MRIAFAPFTATALGLVVACASGALAQERRSSIVGVVRDTAGAPIENAHVHIGSSGPRTTTRADGTFRLEDIEEGTHFVTARRIGFYPETQIARATTGTINLTFELIAVARVLPVVVASADRGGISGVVHDSTLVPLADVEVLALGSSRRPATTDSAGAFFLDVRPGKYMLQVQRDSFATRTISVTVPRDSGRRVVIGLAIRTRPSLVRERVTLANLRERMIRVVRSNQVFTREDLDRMGDRKLNHLAAYAAVRLVDDRCWAIIDGNPQRLEPLWAIDLADVELVEIPAGAAPWASNKALATGKQGCPSIYVWMRR